MDVTPPFVHHAAVHRSLLTMDAKDLGTSGLSRCRDGGEIYRLQKRNRRDPNRARKELQQELESLRIEAQQLQHTLSTLRDARKHVKSSALHQMDVGGEVCDLLRGQFREREASVWREVAARQIRHCAAAESENQRLQKLVQSQRSRIERLQQLCFGRATTKARAEVASRFPTPHPLFEATLHFDSRVFRCLIDRIDKRYREIDQIFLHDCEAVEESTTSHPASHPASPRGHMRYDEKGNLQFQIFGSKVFPFDVQTTGATAWKRFSNSVRPADPFSNKYTNMFSKYYDAPDDTVAELFVSELRLDDANAVVLPAQVKRIYREHERVAIVWQTQVEASEFMGCQLSGAAYEETGYFLIERPPRAPEGFAQLRTCYIIAPLVPTQSLPRNSTAFGLMEFIFKWMASTIPANHDILEGMLIHESLRI